MKRMSAVMMVAFGLLVSGCSSSSPTTPSAANPIFTVDLKPASEVPPVTNAESGGSGTMNITFVVTRDSANNITAAQVNFNGTFQGFPAGTTLTGAHIHPGAAGTTGGVVISTAIAQGEIVFTNGSGTLVKTVASVDSALAQAIINNPSGYYFNIHTSLNPSGVARGQLVKVQ